MTTLGVAAAVLLLVVCVTISAGGAAAAPQQKTQTLYTETFRSPGFRLNPGDVIDKFYQVGMPRGHIALRSLDAQVVDEHGTPVPLYETYLHHWVILKFHIALDSSGEEQESASVRPVPNSGNCQHGLGQWFGLGSETRGTNTTVPPPYGIVMGDPQSVPSGFEEAWFINVHAIDTRGTVNIRGCTECICDLYNVTTDGSGRELPADYEGGLYCCHDEARCALRLGFEASARELFVEYTVTWVEMTKEVVPVRVYILDVTDRRTTFEGEEQCQIEYDVHKCPEGANSCIHTAESVSFLAEGGDLVYAVAHQHSGGVGVSLHTNNGAELCSSFPTYGTGDEAGNESGYIVGMSACYPEPGTVKIKTGEKLRMASLYNNEERHTGVMGLFYLLVADPQSTPQQGGFHIKIMLGAVTIIGAIIFLGVTIFHYQKMRRGGPEYQSIVTPNQIEP